MTGTLESCDCGYYGGSLSTGGCAVQDVSSSSAGPNFEFEGGGEYSAFDKKADAYCVKACMLPSGPKMQSECGSFHGLTEMESRLVSRQALQTRPNSVFLLLSLLEAAISTAISQICKLSLKSTFAATMPVPMPFVPVIRDYQQPRTNVKSLLARIHRVMTDHFGLSTRSKSTKPPISPTKRCHCLPFPLPTIL
jgi:hypothetical protein